MVVPGFARRCILSRTVAALITAICVNSRFVPSSPCRGEWVGFNVGFACNLRVIQSQCAACTRAALKEIRMKHKLSLLKSLPVVAGLLAFALSPALMQAQNMGKIHGHVINPTGQPQDKGTVSLSTDSGATLKFSFP